MSQRVGITETKEALQALNEVSIHLLEAFKRGLTIGTALELWSEWQSGLSEKVVQAYENIKSIPDELSDLDAVEMFELAQVQLSYLSRIITAIKKDSPAPEESAPTPALLEGN